MFLSNDYTDGLLHTEPHLHSWNKVYLIIVYNHLHILLSFISYPSKKYFVKNFTYTFVRDINQYFLYCLGLNLESE